MSKKIIFIILLLINGSLVIVFNKQLNNIPPLGKFLNPYNGFWKNAKRNKIESLNKIDLKGLKQSLTIQYDRMLIMMKIYFMLKDI